MNLVEKINEDTKDALKAGDQLRLSTLRMLSSELKNKKIELKKDLSEEEVFSLISKEAKKRIDTAKTFTDAGRTDLALKEQAEAKILESYLPAQLSDEELGVLVDEAIAQAQAATKADMGKVMGSLKEKVAGRADGARVAQMVQSKLS